MTPVKTDFSPITIHATCKNCHKFSKITCQLLYINAPNTNVVKTTCSRCNHSITR